MKWRKFDKKVNNELSGHQSEVDIDALWGAIEPEVDAINSEKKKRRRGAFWWFFGGLLLLGMVAAGLFFSKNDAADIAHLNTKNQTVEKTTNTDFDENEIATPIENTVNKVSKNEVKVADLNTENATADIEQKVISKPENLNQNKKTTFEEIDLNGKTEVLIAENQVALKEKVEQATVENPNSILADNSQLSVDDKNQLFSLPINSMENIEGKTSDLTRTTLTKEEKQATEKEIREARAEAEAKKSAEKKFNAAISFYGGVSLANRNLLSDGDSTNAELAQLRQNTEKSLETIQLGFLFNWQHEKTGLELTSGINYTQINEKFEYRNNQMTVDSIQGVEAFYRNVNGDTIAIMGMIPQTTTATIHKRHYNKYRMIDVPLLLGYRREFGNFSIGAQAGVFVNLNLQTSGRFFANETEDIDIDNEEIFKTNVGLSYYFGATIDYQLTKKWAISASPNFRYFPNSFSEASYGISQKYSLYGVNVGLRYSF